jgi:hypothetical protein
LDSVEQMEFRIFHNIFCSTFQIQKDAFAFDEYVAKVFQRFVLEVIEIRLLDWAYVVVILCLNLGRVKLNLQWMACEVHDLNCHERRDVYLFTCVGRTTCMPTTEVVSSYPLFLIQAGWCSYSWLACWLPPGASS